MSSAERVILRGGVVAFLLLVVLPLRGGDVGVDSIDEHRVTESLSIALRHAERGYWAGYPDPRRVIDEPRRELVEAVGREIRAGRLRAHTPLLHLASSFQQWSGTPFGVFAGVHETTVSLDPEYSGHTLGGRLYGIADLPVLLDEGFEYVVLEPDGLPAGLRDAIVAAGYEPIFANARGEVFAAA